MTTDTFFNNAINETVTPFIRQTAEEVISENELTSEWAIVRETTTRFNKKYEGVKINRADARPVVRKLLDK